MTASCFPFKDKLGSSLACSSNLEVSLWFRHGKSTLPQAPTTDAHSAPPPTHTLPFATPSGVTFARCFRLDGRACNWTKGKIDYAEAALIKTCFSGLLAFCLCLCGKATPLPAVRTSRRSSAAGAIQGNFVCARYLSPKEWPRAGVNKRTESSAFALGCHLLLAASPKRFLTASEWHARRSFPRFLDVPRIRALRQLKRGWHTLPFQGLPSMATSSTLSHGFCACRLWTSRHTLQEGKIPS